MNLAELDPQFYRYETRQEEGKVREYRVPVSSLAEAQCVFFLCPVCRNKQNHQVEVTFANRGVQDHQGTHNSSGRATRWEVSGTNYTDLTTTPSVLLESGCKWHGFITAGEVSVL